MAGNTSLEAQDLNQLVEEALLQVGVDVVQVLPILLRVNLTGWLPAPVKRSTYSLNRTDLSRGHPPFGGGFL